MPNTYKSYTTATKAEAVFLVKRGVRGSTILLVLGLSSDSLVYRWKRQEREGKLSLPEVSPERQSELLVMAGVKDDSVPDDPTPNLPVVIDPRSIDNHGEEGWEEVAAFNELLHLRLSYAQLLIRVGGLERESQELTEKLEAAYKRAKEDVADATAEGEALTQIAEARADHFLKMIDYLMEEIRKHA